MPLEVGQPIGPYRLNRHLGAGGMAEVWSATHQVLGIQVALKVMFHGDSASQDRFFREGRAQAALDHPNILPVRDVIDVRGTPGLVLPLVDGPSLRQLLLSYRPSEGEALALFVPIVEGMNHAHQRGLVHRDLNPANVLLEIKTGRVVPRVADFGLVKSVHDQGTTRAGAVMGTLAYTAPEQLLDAANVDQRADIFSLGAVLFELLTGERPFRGTTLGEILDAHRRGADLDPLSDRWRNLCRDMLELDPERRIASCAPVLTVLREEMSALSKGALDGHRQLARAAREVARGGTLEIGGGSLSGAADTFPPVQLASAPPPPETPHNLPAEPNRFVGRDVDLRRLEGALERCRLVTVTGPGGTGKTRLTIHFARQRLRTYPGGVYLCSLADARSVEGIVRTVSDALEVPLGRDDPMARIGHAIAGRGRCLVILDSFEHIVAHADRTVGAWMRRAEHARFVVTSQVLLGLDGEEILVLEPLEEDDAIELFEERARSRGGRSSSSEDQRTHVRELVRLLDRLPLAIELATARSKLMSPRTMLARLGRRFELLRTRKRSAGHRHATLRAAIDWSWVQLTEWEKAAFAHCAVFRGGFTLEAAEAILDLDAFADAPWPLDAVQSLVDRSLLQVSGAPHSQEVRFEMLASIYDYAREKLRDRPDDEVADLGRRHCAFYAKLGEDDALAALTAFGGAERWWALSAEFDNLQAANELAVRSSDITRASQTALACFHVAQRGQPATAIPVVSSVLEMEGVRALPQRWARLAMAMALVEIQQGQYDQAQPRLRSALAVAREVGDRRIEGMVLVNLASLLKDLGQNAEAASLHEHALAIARDCRDRRIEVYALIGIASTHTHLGEYEQAGRHLEQALRVARLAGDRQSECLVLLKLGNLNLSRGQLAIAERHYREGIQATLEVGERPLEGVLVGNLGAIFVALGRPDEAVEQYHRELVIARATGLRRSESVVLCNLATLDWLQGRGEAAAQRYHEALALARETGNQRSEAEVLGRLGNLHRDRGEMDVAVQHYEKALAIARETGLRSGEGLWLGEWAHCLALSGQLHEGLAMLREAEALLRDVDPFRLGELLCHVAEAERLAENLPAALDALDEARRLARELGAGPDSPLGQAIARTESRLG